MCLGEAKAWAIVFQKTPATLNTDLKKMVTQRWFSIPSFCISCSGDIKILWYLCVLRALIYLWLNSEWLWFPVIDKVLKPQEVLSKQSTLTCTVWTHKHPYSYWSCPVGYALEGQVCSHVLVPIAELLGHLLRKQNIHFLGSTLAPRPQLGVIWSLLQFSALCIR